MVWFNRINDKIIDVLLDEEETLCGYIELINGSYFFASNHSLDSHLSADDLSAIVERIKVLETSSRIRD